MIRSRLANSAPRLLAIPITLVMLLGTATPAAAALPVTLLDDGLAAPVGVVHAGDARLFVLEKAGVIKIANGGTFLDISAKIDDTGERGLLSVAFHPNYASNGLFYVDYTRQLDGDIILAEYRRSSGNPNLADPNYERILMRIEHSCSTRHNGGTIEFLGQLLYITTGDGACAAGNAQDLSSLLGKVLRINPLDPDGNGPKTYGIPPKNPYVGRTGRDEIWARGLRNPWRCSIDDVSTRLFCGDVGERDYEEVNRAKTGKAANYGWPLLEGTHYYSFPGEDSGDPCTHDCRYLPFVEYAHVVDGEDNNAVTGGYVSRRPGATLQGKYIYGDFGSGRVWSIPWDAPLGTPPTLLADTDYSISSFGEGWDKKLYLVDLTGGAVYRLNDS